MRAIHKYVNLIPVMAKSDSMTLTESNEFESLILASIAAGRVVNPKNPSPSTEPPIKIEIFDHPSFEKKNNAHGKIFRIMGCNAEARLSPDSFLPFPRLLLIAAEYGARLWLGQS